MGNLVNNQLLHFGSGAADPGNTLLIQLNVCDRNRDHCLPPQNCKEIVTRLW
jgi:hypothetical protein